MLGFARYCLVLLDCRELLGIAGYCLALLAIARHCWLLLGNAGNCLALVAITGYCWGKHVADSWQNLNALSVPLLIQVYRLKGCNSEP